MSYRISKPKLSPSDIVTKMRDEKGIKFKNIDEINATTFLSDHNNYLRTACYRVLYPKYQAGPNKGMYINLDFSYLKELSIIDMHYRFLVKKMCSDIEHSLCMKLLKQIDNDTTTDGYDIVNQFLTNYSYVINNLERSISSPHTGDLIKKYFSISISTDPTTGKSISHITAYDDCPAWVLVECLTFGDLLEFYNFYNSSRSIPLPAKWSTLNLVRNLRNGASHDACLLCHLASGTSIPSAEIINAIKAIGNISTSQRQKKLSSRTLLEFSALIYLYNLVVRDEVRQHRILELHNLFFTRIPREKTFFSDNNILTTSYEFCCKVINYYL